MRYTFMFAQLSHAIFLGYDSDDQETNIGLSLQLFGESEHAQVQGLDLCFWDAPVPMKGIGDFHGLNLGVVNSFENSMNGIQGNLLLSAATTAKGLQIGLWSGCERLTGCQIGFITASEEVAGCQIGLISGSERSTGTL